VSNIVLILRPQPGADESAARARALGLDPVVAPLFTVRPLAWEAPNPADFDAVMMTSANAARFGGDALTPFTDLPCYPVGEATAAMACKTGFRDIRTGPGDGAALIGMMAAAGVGTVFHPCGVDRQELDPAGLRILETPVYAAEPIARLSPRAKSSLDKGALVLLHSPRAASLFSQLRGTERARIRLAAISAAAAAEAGNGWRSISIAALPRDQALLELAAKLCQTAPE